MDSTLCEQICNNTVGSYECKCEDGYQLVAGTNQCTGNMDYAFRYCYHTNLNARAHKNGHLFLCTLVNAMHDVSW